MDDRDCGECGASWLAPCEPCVIDRRRNELFAAYGIPTERPVIGERMT